VYFKTWEIPINTIYCTFPCWRWQAQFHSGTLVMEAWHCIMRKHAAHANTHILTMKKTKKSPLQEKRILLIEDEEIIVNLLTRKLEAEGYFVEVARDGALGLQLIRKKKPDLVLLDILLPKMNGFGILETLHKEKILPELPVIIISNSGQPIEVERALKLGVRDYFMKTNFDPDKVLAKVKLIFKPSGGAPVKSIEKTAIPENSSQARHDDVPQGSGAQGTVLLIEDDVLLAGILSRKLQKKGFRVHQVANISQARATLEEKKKIDLICLDLILPGTDGLAYLEELKKHPQFKNIPVLILSNLGKQEEVERGIKAGAADYIIKATMSPGGIVEKVESLIKK